MTGDFDWARDTQPLGGTAVAHREEGAFYSIQRVGWLEVEEGCGSMISGGWDHQE